jgi:glycosyltransferase involved in cell wall biosynthesis
VTVPNDPRPLLDLHHLGHRQTGNESWARSLATAMFEFDGPSSYDIAVTGSAPAVDLDRLPARHRVRVSPSSTRRLGWDLPRAMRRLGTPAVLVQYTVPLSGVPTVVMVHDLSFEDPRAAAWLPRTTRLRYRATVRASVRRAAHLLTVSDYSKADLVRVYGLDADDITVVPNAVDPGLAAGLAATAREQTTRPVVLMVGNVVPRKNLPVVADAVRRLRSGGQDAVLRVVGSVPRSGRADAELARRHLGGDVHFTGYVTPAQLAREFRSASVLAFPSLFEGFGIPVLEGMAAGLPVVVSDRTSLPEVVGDAGLIASAEDAEAWAEALGCALEPAESARLVAAGTRRLADFSWAASARLVSAALRRAAG